MPFKKPSHSGFTLIEVLIAIVILSFITLAAYKMVDDGTDIKDKITTEDRDLMQTQTALMRLDTDFAEFYSPLFSFSKVTMTQNGNDPYQDNSSTFTKLFEGVTRVGMPIPQVQSDDKSSLIFLATVNRRRTAESHESNFVWIKYSARSATTDEGRKRGGMELIRQVISKDPFGSRLNWNDAHPQVVLEFVKNLEFSYYDERGKKFVNSLSELNENKSALRSIIAKIDWVDMNQHDVHFEKNYRILFPYFNTKQDDLKLGTGSDAWDGGTPMTGLPDPNNPQGMGSDQKQL